MFFSHFSLCLKEQKKIKILYLATFTPTPTPARTLTTVASTFISFIVPSTPTKERHELIPSLFDHPYLITSLTTLIQPITTSFIDAHTTQNISHLCGHPLNHNPLKPQPNRWPLLVAKGHVCALRRVKVVAAVVYRYDGI